MQATHDHSTLLYYSQVLRAKIALRDHYLDKIVREIYENSGQLLSLVRMQLSTLQEKADKDLGDALAFPAEIIAEVIRKWKEMGRNLDPEQDLTSELGIVRALQLELRNVNSKVSHAQFTVTGAPFALSANHGLIYFHLVLDVTTLIISLYGEEALKISIDYGAVTVTIILKYLRKPLDGHKLHQAHDEYTQIMMLEPEERIRLINGEVKISNKKNAFGKIKISMPARA